MIISYLPIEKTVNICTLNSFFKNICYAKRTNLTIKSANIKLDGALCFMENLVSLTVLEFSNEINLHFLTVLKILASQGKLKHLRQMKFVQIYFLTKLDDVLYILKKLGITHFDCKQGSVFTVGDIYAFVANCPSLKFFCTDKIVFYSAFDKKWLANLLNENLGKVTFGHSVIDSLPRCLLNYSREAYSF